MRMVFGHRARGPLFFLKKKKKKKNLNLPVGTVARFPPHRPQAFRGLYSIAAGSQPHAAKKKEGR